MGKFKDETGKTRVGVFLQQVAPEILSVASSLTGIKALDRLGEAIDGSSKLNPAQKAHAKELLELDLQYEKELTERHKTDMASDNLLSKNIRPLTLIFLLIVVSFLAFLDSALGEEFVVPEGYISLYNQLLLAAFGFYFIGREINKGILNHKKHKNEKHY